MKPIKRGKGKDKGYWTWLAENPPALYREPIRPGRAPSALNRRRVREMRE